MSKFYKVLLVVSLFLTVIATSAITTVIIPPSSAQASSYFADDVQRDLKGFVHVYQHLKWKYLICTIE